eukprot:12281-Heterococcus_DN1.PRE.1
MMNREHHHKEVAYAYIRSALVCLALHFAGQQDYSSTATDNNYTATTLPLITLLQLAMKH